MSTYDHTNIPKASRMQLAQLLPPKSLDRDTRARERWIAKSLRRNHKIVKEIAVRREEDRAQRKAIRDAQRAAAKAERHSQPEVPARKMAGKPRKNSKPRKQAAK